MTLLTEATELLHKARSIIKRQHAGIQVTDEERLEFLADTESLLACGLGENIDYAREEQP